MKNNIVLITLFLSILSCSTKRNIPQITPIQNNYYKIEVIQNEEILKPDKENVIRLKKEPFKFKVTFIETDHIFISSSWDKFYYDFPKNEKIIGINAKGEPTTDDILYKSRFAAQKNCYEENFNEQKDLKIGSAKYHFTLYYGEKNCSVEKGWENINGEIHGELMVENINDMDIRTAALMAGNKLVTRKTDGTKILHTEYQDDEGSTIKYFYPLAEVKKDIYVVFASLNYNNNDIPISLSEQRDKFILRFN